MKFEDLPASAQEQISEQMLHEEPDINMRPDDVKAVRELKAERERKRTDADDEVEELMQIAEECEQERFDKAIAEAADVPLDFVQLYNKIEAEVSAAVDGKQPQHVTSAAVIQLVSHYCAAAAEQRIIDLKETNDALAEAVRASENTVANRDEIVRKKERRIAELKQRLNVLHIAVGLLMEKDDAPEIVITDEYLRRTEPKLVTIYDERAHQRTRITVETQGPKDA
ncbi:hypothetical protein SEA_ZARTROSA_45 [Arthrobacter phage Zartrosa]|uniref:Uncharacterized protein n=1 Tax=Arthrobacter phage Zartrosa TaxID=2603257 RepID=A0A5B8WHK9_9CAUD|nr:hypothetical protein HYP98_gp45 [Arthrobacter phage Zartrosa]QED11157.1 hypothetical protein SEA_ZARTROSA_45 [Arthrobacter phage Zartrosa]